MLSPTLKKDVRFELARFCKVAQKYERRWSYTQQRPYSGLGAPPSGWHHNDCSSYLALAFWWAGYMAGAGVADPLGEHYSGWGNTDTCYRFLQTHRAPLDKYRIGDVALYLEGPIEHHHVVVCITGGTRTTSWWSSHGRTAGPEQLRLDYRHDLTDVYRHPALA